MKIALVCPASLPATQFGGILFLCVNIAKELSKLGHEITIYTTDLDFANNPKTFNKNLPRLESINGFSINRTHVWLSFQLFFINPGMYKQIIRDNPDVIHSIGIRSFQSFMAALISKNHHIPLVISDQGGLTTHPDLKKKFTKRILYKIQNPFVKFVINQANKISVANEYERSIFSNLGAESKTVIIRNGIDLESLKCKTIDFNKKYNISNSFILFLGRFNEVKGIDILLRAWVLIKDKTKERNLKLIIMGADFGFESKMFELIRELDIDDSVKVIKNPPREDVIAAYQSSEFLVLPSRWELSPLTPLEGFAFKKTVISSKAHGIPFTIKDKENALLVEPENHEELAKAIIELVDDEVKRTEYGLAGFNMVNKICNSKIMAMNTLKIYQEVIKR